MMTTFMYILSVWVVLSLPIGVVVGLMISRARTAAGTLAPAGTMNDVTSDEAHQTADPMTTTPRLSYSHTPGERPELQFDDVEGEHGAKAAVSARSSVLIGAGFDTVLLTPDNARLVAEQLVQAAAYVDN